MTLTNMAVTALFAILLGLGICFSSYRLFRLYLLAMGFLAGFTMVMTWNGTPIDMTNLPLLMLAVLVGITVGRLACVLFRSGVALPGVLLGIFAAYLLIQSVHIDFIIAAALVMVCAGAGAIRQLSNLPEDPYLPWPDAR